MEIPWKCLFCKDEEPLPIAESTMIDTGMFFFFILTQHIKGRKKGESKGEPLWGGSIKYVCM